MNKVKEQVAALHCILRDVVDKFDHLVETKGISAELEAKKPNLESLLLLVNKIRRQQNPSIPKTIGFFGAQKRGKSSLINCLLGCDLMPVNIIPMSSVVIKARQDDSIETGHFKLDIIKINGANAFHNPNSLEAATELLKQFGSRGGALSDNVEEIQVASSFPKSTILQNGGVLVDTPGAELLFSEDITEAEEKNQADLERALSILDDTQIIVFCERADYLQSKNSQNLYINKMQKRNPLNVINFKDKYQLQSQEIEHNLNPEMLEQTKMNKIKNMLISNFGARVERTLCVSSKEGKQGVFNKDNELLIQSNIPRLESRIISEIEMLEPAPGMESCLGDLYKYLVQFKEPKLYPDKLKLDNFIALIAGEPQFSEALTFAGKISNEL